MDYISGALAGPPGDKLKLATTAQLVLSLILTIWIPAGSVIALVGILSVILGQVELLRLFFYLNAASLGVNVLKLIYSWKISWFVGFLLLLEVALQGVAEWYAYHLLNDTQGSDSYAAFGGEGHGAPRADPFQSYEPPPANNTFHNDQHQPPQQQQKQHEPQSQQQPPNLV